MDALPDATKSGLKEDHEKKRSDLRINEAVKLDLFLLQRGANWRLMLGSVAPNIEQRVLLEVYTNE
jgi:hypothetical protein